MRYCVPQWLAESIKHMDCEVVETGKCIKSTNTEVYLHPAGEKQRTNISSRASRRTWKLGEWDTRQMHLSAKEFAGI